MNALRRIVCCFLLAAGALCPGCTPYAPDPENLRDPVCGARVQLDRAIIRYYDQWAYYFDTEDCARKFEQHPARYIDMTHYVLERQDG
jgi:YHS domain-containing protein